MIVNRRVFIAKKGHMDEGIALLKAAIGVLPPPVRARCFKANLAPFDSFGFEVEYENLAEYERLAQEWRSRGTPEWWQQWLAITETGGTNEIWDLV